MFKLKTIFAYILLITIAFRPIYNIGYLAYYELNIDYIIETYCINKEKPEFKCNGKCHLASKLTGNSAEEKDTTSILNAIFEAFTPVYFQASDTCLALELFPSSKSQNWNYNRTFSSYKIDKLSPPPWA